MDQNISHYSHTAHYSHWLTALATVGAYLLVDLGDVEGSGCSSPPSLMLQEYYS